MYNNMTHHRRPCRMADGIVHVDATSVASVPMTFVFDVANEAIGPLPVPMS